MLGFQRAPDESVWVADGLFCSVWQYKASWPTPNSTQAIGVTRERPTISWDGRYALAFELDQTSQNYLPTLYRLSE